MFLIINVTQAHYQIFHSLLDIFAPSLQKYLILGQRFSLAPGDIWQCRGHFGCHYLEDTPGTGCVGARVLLTSCSAWDSPTARNGSVQHDNSTEFEKLSPSHQP